MQRKIDGTFFEFLHHNTAEGKYWNDALNKFTAEDWKAKIKEIADLKMEYIVLMATALYDKCYFRSSVFPFADIPCSDPIEAILSAADEYGVKVFLGNGFYGDWRKAARNIKDEAVISRSFKAMEELSALYAHHKSFYGWYYPDEACIILKFSIGRIVNFPFLTSLMQALVGRIETPRSFRTSSLIVATLSTSSETLKFSMFSLILTSVDSNNCLVAEEGKRKIIFSLFNSFIVTIDCLDKGFSLFKTHTR